MKPADTIETHENTADGLAVYIFPSRLLPGTFAAQLEDTDAERTFGTQHGLPTLEEARAEARRILGNST